MTGKAPVEDAALTPADVLSANLLSLRLGWREVVPLFAEGQGEPQDLLRALNTALATLRTAPAFEDHDTLEALEETVAPLAAANDAALPVPKWTHVTVSKVLHRRLPAHRADHRFSGTSLLRCPGSQVRAGRVVGGLLQEHEGWVADLAQGHQTPDERPLSVLRCADVLIWSADWRCAKLSESGVVSVEADAESCCWSVPCNLLDRDVACSDLSVSIVQTTSAQPPGPPRPPVPSAGRDRPQAAALDDQQVTRTIATTNAPSSANSINLPGEAEAARSASSTRTAAWPLSSTKAGSEAWSPAPTNSSASASALAARTCSAVWVPRGDSRTRSHGPRAPGWPADVKRSPRHCRAG